MADLWQTIQEQYDQLTNKLADPSLDSQDRITTQKKLARVNPLLNQKKRVDSLALQIVDLEKQLSATQEADMKELFEIEISEVKQQLAQAREELDDLMYPPDEHDDRSVYLEIRAGAGGQEAALFVADLLKMYTNYAQSRHWRVQIESISDTDLGGFRDAVLHIKGKDVFGHLKYESGVHRVQRVPATETQGRVHTSTATVAVLPEAKEVDVVINPADLRIDVFRSGGAGGQHVNTTDSAVRITHLPTGVVVSCQDERSQHKNKDKAMKILQSRILLAQMEKQMEEQSKQRKEQIGSGMRAEKVRTYNYPQNRITDHQVDLTLKKLDIIMEGALGEIIDALRQMDREERKRQSFVV